MRTSNLEKIVFLCLDKNINVLPGHFMDWTEANNELLISEKLEKVIQNNASVYAIESPEKFTEYIQENMKKSPDIYNEIRKVNTEWFDVDIDEADAMDLGKNECAATAYANTIGLD